MPSSLRHFGLPLVAILGLTSAACSHGGHARQPMGHITVSHLENPEDAPEAAKTVQVEYVFNRDLANRDFDKTLKDGFEKKGLRVDETLKAHAHFDVKDAKISGTVTYVKKGFGHYSIVEAELVASGHYDADVQVDMDVQMKGDSKKAKDGDWDKTIVGGKPIELVRNIMPTNIPIAGPLFLHAHFDLSAACDMQVNGQVHATTGVGISGDVRLATRYKKAGIEHADGHKSKFAFEAKTPNFGLAPRPFLTVTSGQQHVTGRCMLQPTAVLLLEHSVGAKLSVEPYVQFDAQKTPGQRWQLGAEAGVSVVAATDIEVFGRQLRKAKEHTLFEVALLKQGEAIGTSPPRAVAAAELPRVAPPPPRTGALALNDRVRASAAGSKRLFRR